METKTSNIFTGRHSVYFIDTWFVLVCCGPYVMFMLQLQSHGLAWACSRNQSHNTRACEKDSLDQNAFDIQAELSEPNSG